jgi:16S rRNA (guanine527-N7)-methyltransferase
MPGSLELAPDAIRISQLLHQLCPDREVPEPTQQALLAWLRLVVDWNRKIDLTAARTRDELVDLFLADAVVLHRARLELGEQSGWLDLGSGAGAPGLGMAILDPGLAMTLVEPSAKRVAFLRQVVGRLHLTAVQVRCARAESLGAAQSSDVVSRATWSPGEWLDHGLRLTTKRVWILLARDTWRPPADCRVEYECEYLWPLTGVARRVVAVSFAQQQSER